jgi:ArsR family transcriptional regulator
MLWTGRKREARPNGVLLRSCKLGGPTGAERMARRMMSLTTASDLASLFETLSDPTRVRIIAALIEGETGFAELVAGIGLTDSAVSHQLRGLRDRRLIRTRKQGRNVFIRLDDDHVVEMFRRGLDHVRHR